MLYGDCLLAFHGFAMSLPLQIILCFWSAEENYEEYVFNTIQWQNSESLAHIVTETRF